jgi:prepilin-type N-terminal cleavage/methylation domain-containing protein
MKKLKAFTLFELLVGMIISSIVIGFGYAGYTLIYRQYLNYSVTKRGIIDVVQLNAILNNDFITSESAKLEMDKLILNYENGLQKEYSFGEKYILRKEQEYVDTLKIGVMNVIANRNGDEQVTDLLISELSFDAVIHEETMHFHFIKSYSAETFINNPLNQWLQ